MQKLLFTELRVLQSEGIKDVSISKKGIKLAFIDQENLRALGYDLKETALLELAQEYSANPEKTPLYKTVMELEPEVKASPMYPNFPQQVIEMSELEYRTNQILHYMSTYGVECLFDVEVKEGWLPTTEVQKREVDKNLLKLKVLDYLSAEQIDELVVNKLIGKKERLLPTELEIAKSVALKENAPIVEEIPFKENIYAIYGDTILNADAETLKQVLSSIRPVFKHPGDVMELVETLVIKNRYKHLRTATKRALVELIESFSKAAIEENLASHRWSKRFLGKGKRKRSVNRNVVLIDYLSFSRFSKNPEAMEIVNQLKSGELISWNQELEIAYTNAEFDKVRELLLQRPGVYFRQINRLYSLGVDVDILTMDVQSFADSLKTQTIVSALNNYKKEVEVSGVFFQALIANLGSKEIETLKGKKVFIDSAEISLENSRISILEKSKEGGYIQNGMAIKIPDEVAIARFFTYWNDERTIDIDLHASGINKEGTQIHVGFYGGYNDSGVTHSGDITHSDAAEYIDIDFEKAKESGLVRIQFNINSFRGQHFKDIETVFTGMMAVSKRKQEVKLYDAKNTFFRHDLTGDYRSVDYAYIDIEKRLLYILGDGQKTRNDLNLVDGVDIKLSMQSYLNILLASQGAVVVDNKEDAEVILGLPKSDEENYYSLIDENYFMGA